MLTLEHFLIFSASLFCIGLAIVLTKRNAIVVLMGIELILNAANVNLIAFSQYDPNLEGQMFALFVMILAAAEVAIALAIVMSVFKYFKRSNVDEFSSLGD